MITLEELIGHGGMRLRAHAASRSDSPVVSRAELNPMIAAITGFDAKYHYQRSFIGISEAGSARHTFAAWDHPILLDIRHGDWGRWYILHGLDFDHLQLTEVNQALMDHLVAQPLFAAHTIGSFRLLDPDVDLPPERQRKRNGEVPEVLASPVDTSVRPPIMSGQVGTYNNVVIHQRSPASRARRIRGYAPPIEELTDVACATCNHFHFNHGRRICAYITSEVCYCQVYVDPRQPSPHPTPPQRVPASVRQRARDQLAGHLRDRMEDVVLAQITGPGVSGDSVLTGNEEVIFYTPADSGAAGSRRTPRHEADCPLCQINGCERRAGRIHNDDGCNLCTCGLSFDDMVSLAAQVPAGVEAARRAMAEGIPNRLPGIPGPRRGRKKPEPKKLDIAPEVSGRKFWSEDD